MKRVMLLTLLGLALPMAVLASSIDPQLKFNTGVPADQATVEFTASFSPSFSVDVVCPSCAPVSGQISPVEMELMTSSLDCSASPFCTFSDGTVTVKSLTDVKLFTDSVAMDTGTMLIGSGTAVIMAELAADATRNITGGNVNFGLSFTADGVPTAGNGSMIVDTAIPEPGTLGLLGTGLIGLGGMAIRKLRLWT